MKRKVRKDGRPMRVTHGGYLTGKHEATQIKRLAPEGEGGTLRRAPLSIERSTISWQIGEAGITAVSTRRSRSFGNTRGTLSGRPAARGR